MTSNYEPKNDTKTLPTHPFIKNDVLNFIYQQQSLSSKCQLKQFHFLIIKSFI